MPEIFVKARISGFSYVFFGECHEGQIFKEYLDSVRNQYSHILIDYQKSQGMLSVNALSAANRVLISIWAEYLPAKGVE